MIYCTYKSCAIEGLVMTLLFMRMVYFSRIYPLIPSCPPHTLTDPLPHPHPLSCLSYDRMDFMKAALTSKGKDLFAGA